MFHLTIFNQGRQSLDPATAEVVLTLPNICKAGPEWGKVLRRAALFGPLFYSLGQRLSLRPESKKIILNFFSTLSPTIKCQPNINPLPFFKVGTNNLDFRKLIYPIAKKKTKEMWKLQIKVKEIIKKIKKKNGQPFQLHLTSYNQNTLKGHSSFRHNHNITFIEFYKYWQNTYFQLHASLPIGGLWPMGQEVKEMHAHK